MIALAEQLLSLLHMPRAARSLLGEQARLRIESRYEIRHVAELYMVFYEGLINTKQGSC
jgi:hypothetical protein